MDYVRYGKWVSIAVLILALVTLPYLSLTIPLRLQATVYDDGPEGFTEFVSELRARGVQVYLQLPDPSTVKDAVLLLLDPQFCLYYEDLEQWVERAKPRLIVVIGESLCARWITARLDSAFARLEYSLVDSGVLRLGDVSIPTISILAMSGEGVKPIGYVGGRAAAVTHGSIIFIGDSDFLRNDALQANPDTLDTIVELMGCDAGCTVVMPSVFETGAIGFALSAYQLARILVEMLANLEEMFLRLSRGLAVLAYVLVAGYVAYKLFLGGFTRGKEEIYHVAPRPSIYGYTRLYQRIVEGGKLSTLEAKTVIMRLYEITDRVLRVRLGAGIDEIVGNEELVARLSSATGIDREELSVLLRRLYKLYRKAAGLSRRPLIVRWRRESERMVTSLGRVLKGLGVELEKLRGLEVVVEYGESRASEKSS
ncbi:hypothetical protein Pyrfu_1043 [Pyrolobus fumarii 1A]|uniref:DUF4350 domain-containing protein n=1 Tax=Pyrolobus fumarii (strain DSM 11204 / 1A) TaxID=694429 RepID=G0EF14_PYRF1|nr:hypothetical protein [Pyrolobus fumarii]AEM38911.1 hypothetical protein Pyrfu_1043 [Pyrolobus fumarii 1A]